MGCRELQNVTKLVILDGAFAASTGVELTASIAPVWLLLHLNRLLLDRCEQLLFEGLQRRQLDQAGPSKQKLQASHF